MLDDDSVIVRSPEVLSGTPVFAGTRVPAKTLIDYLENGDSLEIFLEDFPSVTRKQDDPCLRTTRANQLAENQSYADETAHDHAV